MRKLCILITLLMGIPALAQFTSNVQGTITDPSGSVVPGAVVKLTNTDTNESQSFTSNAAGQYYFNRLAPGPYAVIVTAPGFEKTVQPIRVTTEQTAGVDIHLRVGSASDTVNITAEDSHGLNPDETRVQYTLSAEEIAAFPLQDRSTLSLIRSTPGATGIDEGHQNVAVNRDQASESVAGRSVNSNLFLLDFIPVNSQIGNASAGSGVSGGAITLIPHPDMIAEIALQTTTFSVENGAASGIQSSITTKSGTNKFHGDADYTYTGGPFRANFNGTTNNPPFRQQYVSGALGGPIWRDRTFFFGSYFNQVDEQPVGGFGTFFDPSFITWAQANYPNSQNIARGLVPYPADRAIGTPIVLDTAADLTGYNFVNFGTVACNSGGASAIPTAPNLIPIPCNQAIWDEAPFNATSTDNGMQYNFRLDHSLRQSKDRLNASFFRFDQKSVSSEIQSTFDGATPSTGYYIAGNYTHVFTPSLLNQASFGQTRFEFDYKTTPHSLSQLLLPYLSGCTCVGLNQIQFLTTLREHQSYGRDSISWVKGKHSFTFGFQGAYNNQIQDDSAVYGRPFLQASFFIYDYLNDLSDLELIYTLSANVNNFPGKFIPQLFGSSAVRFGLYGQDSWKITPNFLLTYGLRWDDFGNPASYGKNAEAFSNIKLAQGSTLPQQVAGLSVGLVNDVYTGSRAANFLPRAGFAYTLPFSGRRTVVHGGIGFYEDDLNLSDISANLPTQPPVRLSLTLGQFSTPVAINTYGTSEIQGPPGGNPYGFQFPNYPIYGYSPQGAPLDQNGNVEIGGLFGVDPNMRPPKTLLYNLGLEHELPRHLVVGALYSGSYAYDQLLTTDVNTYPGLYSGEQEGTQVGQRYNAQFGQIKFFRNVATDNYNALILTARQTLGKLTYQASYTYGKALGEPTNNATDQYDLRSQYTNSNGDTRHRITITQLYEVPAVFGNKLLNTSLAGWTLSNALVGQTGQPFTIASTSGSNDFNNDGISYDLPTYVGTKHKFTRSEAHTSFFQQTSVFGDVAGTKSGSPLFIPPPGTNAEGQNNKQNTFWGPGYFDLDTGLSKKFQLPWLFNEHASLALRAEAINLLNHANFLTPGGSYDNLPTAGIVGGTHQGRIIQLGGRLEF